MPTPVTATTAALLALFYFALSMWVVSLRWVRRIGIGDGGDPGMVRAVRVHGNFAEYVPFALLLLLLLEMGGQRTDWVAPLAGLLVVGRLLHALGLARSSRASPPRFVGMVLTYIALTTPALLLLVDAMKGRPVAP